MMQHIAGNGVRTIIVETANRFARDHYAELSRRGFDLESGRPSFGRGGFCCGGSGLNTIWTFKPSNNFKILLN
jgi:hypothetical protein